MKWHFQLGPNLTNQLRQKGYETLSLSWIMCIYGSKILDDAKKHFKAISLIEERNLVVSSYGQKKITFVNNDVKNLAQGRHLDECKKLLLFVTNKKNRSVIAQINFRP